ncbi:hypothetical protein SAMN05428959_10473 [Duganella sp. CF517]|uniref:hypothetical protein n=1 Tax=Duganella sp. CF517 TaxID=1881038 RepID=UPI0008B5BF85|nr:hypothetical protein [Duganella sp. CF517]SEN99392.1 hypothetical protein SAMN05428959_10473 [Duganella sp. CF517]
MNAAAKPTEIDLDQAAAGMTLASALLDAHGGVLLPRDAALTDSMLASLRRRGVERCVVWAPEEAAAVDPAQLARERELRMQRLQRLFRHSGDDTGAETGGGLLLRVLRAYRERDPA